MVHFWASVGRSVGRVSCWLGVGLRAIAACTQRSSAAAAAALLVWPGREKVLLSHRAALRADVELTLRARGCLLTSFAARSTARVREGVTSCRPLSLPPVGRRPPLLRKVLSKKKSLCVKKKTWSSMPSGSLPSYICRGSWASSCVLSRLLSLQ